jgi:biopolymer transport protein ExbD
VKPLPKRELPVVPTANLVDIAILLIIFYMACSHFVTKSAGKITPPKAPNLAQLKEPQIIVTIDKEGGVFVQGAPAGSPAALQSTLTELIKGRTNDDDRQVMFKCDASVNRTVFEPVLDAIVQSGGLILAVGEDGPAE